MPNTSKQQGWRENTEYWARKFHDTYEKLAPEYGYETRSDTKKFDPSSQNGRLMIAVVNGIVKQIENNAYEQAAEVARGKKTFVGYCRMSGRIDDDAGPAYELACEDIAEDIIKLKK